MPSYSLEALLRLEVNTLSEFEDSDRAEEFFELLIEKFHEQYDGIKIEVEKWDINEW